MVADDFSDNNPLPIGHITFGALHEWHQRKRHRSGHRVPDFAVYRRASSLGNDREFQPSGNAHRNADGDPGASLSYSSGTFTAAPVAPAIY